MPLALASTRNYTWSRLKPQTFIISLKSRWPTGSGNLVCERWRNQSVGACVDLSARGHGPGVKSLIDYVRWQPWFLGTARVRRVIIEYIIVQYYLLLSHVRNLDCQAAYREQQASKWCWDAGYRRRIVERTPPFRLGSHQLFLSAS